MTRALMLGLALALLAACADEPAAPTTPGTSPKPGASSVPGTSPAAPLPSVTSPVAVGNLTGKWVFGSRDEPPAGPVGACREDQVMSINEQHGTIAGAIAACGSTCDQVESFSGSNNGGEVVLQGSFKGNLDSSPHSVSYVLKFDPRTQHLVGTRSGAPFWAAPWVVPATGCQPSPSPAASIAPGGAAGGGEQ